MKLSSFSNLSTYSFVSRGDEFPKVYHSGTPDLARLTMWPRTVQALCRSLLILLSHHYNAKNSTYNTINYLCSELFKSRLLLGDVPLFPKHPIKVVVSWECIVEDNASSNSSSDYLGQCMEVWVPNGREASIRVLYSAMS
jgi:hypothetical protein